MRARREIPVELTPAALWQLLWDVGRIVACVPGCDDAREIEAHQRYAARMTQRVGPIKLSVPLEVEVVEAEPPHRMVLDAKGRDRALGAEISMRVALEIEPRGPASALCVDAEARILGKLGSLGQGVIQRKAEEALEEFGVRLQAAARG